MQMFCKSDKQIERTYMFQSRKANSWDWSGPRSIKIMSMKAVNSQNVLLLVIYFEFIKSEKCVSNLKVDGGLVSARSLLFPNSSLVAFTGVNGRWVAWTRRDRLASFTISALVLIRGFRCWGMRLKNCCFLSAEAILSDEALKSQCASDAKRI